MKNQRSLLMQLSRELRESIHAGAALAALTLAAGCSGDDVTAPGTGGEQSPAPHDRTPSNPAQHTQPEAAAPPQPTEVAPAVQLPSEPYPLSSLGCYGPSNEDGYYGQCCFEAQCYAPAAGEACLPAGDIAALPRKLQLPPGSGECGCRVESEGREYLTGPFAPNPADSGGRGAGSEGSCCYVVGSIGCMGRPLWVGGKQRIAAAIVRADWLPV